MRRARSARRAAGRARRACRPPTPGGTARRCADRPPTVRRRHRWRTCRGRGRWSSPAAWKKSRLARHLVHHPEPEGVLVEVLGPLDVADVEHGVVEALDRHEGLNATERPPFPRPGARGLPTLVGATRARTMAVDDEEVPHEGSRGVRVDVRQHASRGGCDRRRDPRRHRRRGRGHAGRSGRRRAPRRYRAPRGRRTDARPRHVAARAPGTRRSRRRSRRGATSRWTRTPKAPACATGSTRSATSPRVAAAFDTRVDGPASLTGRASKGIGKRLRKHGCSLVVAPQSFLVTKQNHLVDDEAHHAHDWGAWVARACGAEVGTPSR